MSEKGPGNHHLPGDLSALSLPLKTVEKSWFRCHRREYDAIYFGKSGDLRFDAPDREFGVMYLGESPEAAFVETLIRGKSTERHVTSRELHENPLSEIRFGHSLRLVDLTESGLILLGADARICTGGNYSVSQRWVLALWKHPAQPDGILYCSRHNLSLRCAAVFDRAGGAVTISDFGSLTDLRHRNLLGQLLDLYGFNLLH